MTVTVRELKTNLSRCLKRAASGEEIVVTSRGRPVARLVRPIPERQGENLSSAEIHRRLAAIPNIILPTGPKPRGSKSPLRIRKGEKSLADIVLEGRR